MHLTLVSLFNNSPHTTFSVYYLSSILKKYNHRCSLIFLLRTKTKGYINRPRILPTDKEIDAIIEKIKTLKPDIVGINVYSTFLHASIRLTKELQKRLNIHVIWGGVHPTIAPEECIQFADMICIGEGEEVILELAEKIQKGSDVSQIKNLWVRKNGTVIKNDVRPLIQNLDSLPFPDFEDKDCYRICTDGVYKHKGPGVLYNIISSRGCPFLCSYCNEGLIRKIYKNAFRYRMRSPENVIAEVTQIRKNKILRAVSFHDPNFPFETEWVRKFTRLYKKEIDLAFSIRIHPSVISEENIDLLVKAGLYRIEFGIESGSEYIRKEIFHKPITNSRLIEIQGFLSRHKNLTIYNGYIVDNPFETMEEKKKSLDFLLSIPGRFIIRPGSLQFYPGCDITRRALREKKITDYDLSLATRAIGPGIVLNQKRSKEEKFWISLVFLIVLYHRLRLFPKRAIYFISRNNLLKRYPQLLFIATYSLYKILLRGRRFKVIKILRKVVKGLKNELI